MSGYLYILQSNESGGYYIGSSDDPDRRYKQHLSGHTYSTRRMKDLKLVFTQEFPSLAKARAVERKIKKWKRRDFIEKIIRDGIIKST